MADDRHQEAMDTLVRPAVSKSDRARSGWGSLLISVQTLPGRCAKDRKCIQRDGHETACWPKED